MGTVSTSQASQGKTVDRVLIGQSAESFPASSREQFTCRYRVAGNRRRIYTDDKKALLAAVSRSDDRLAATEFVNKRERVSVLQRQQSMAPDSPERDNPRPRAKEMEHER